jgi:hypothetical protein
MLHTVGAVLATAAVFFDVSSYVKQIEKTLRVKHSKDVSTRAYMLKILKIFCSTTSLAIFANWVGLFMETCALAACVSTFIVVIKYKPKSWRLFQ